MILFTNGYLIQQWQGNAKFPWEYRETVIWQCTSLYFLMCRDLFLFIYFIFVHTVNLSILIICNMPHTMWTNNKTSWSLKHNRMKQQWIRDFIDFIWMISKVAPWCNSSPHTKPSCLCAGGVPSCTLRFYWEQLISITLNSPNRDVNSVLWATAVSRDISYNANLAR